MPFIIQVPGGAQSFGYTRRRIEPQVQNADAAWPECAVLRLFRIFPISRRFVVENCVPGFLGFGPVLELIAMNTCTDGVSVGLLDIDWIGRGRNGVEGGG